MSFKPVSIWVVLLCCILDIPFSFSEEVYRWTDEKGTIHFTEEGLKWEGCKDRQASSRGFSLS
jgi:hypothetical protein